MCIFRLSTPVSLFFSSLLFLGTIGCMHPAGMGPGYMNPYQPMYGAPGGGMAAPGTYVVPPGNAPLYSPSNSSGTGTFEAAPTDGFDAPNGSDNSGGVPRPKDPGSSTDPNNGTNSPFFNDIPQGT